MTRKDSWLWSGVFALLTLFSTGRWALAPVAWVAPALGLFIVHRNSTRRGVFLIYATTFCGASIGWYGTIPFPLPIYVVFMLFNAFVGTLPYLIDRLLVPRFGHRLAATLIFPLAVTSVEYLLLADGPLGSFGAQAYTQSGLGPLVQFASVAGLWGITFVVAWFASTVHWAIRRYQLGLSFIGGAALYTAVVVVILGFGTVRVLFVPEARQSVSVASFTAAHVDMVEMTQLAQIDAAAFRQRTEAQHTAYLNGTIRAAKTGAQIVLWPELAGLGMVDDVNRLVERGRVLADDHNIYLAMPLFTLDPTGKTQSVNKLVIADPNGTIVLQHVKYGGNLLEGTLPGTPEVQTVDTPFGRLAAVICWDTDYPAVIRQAGQQNVDILLSPAFVWPEVAAIHAEMASFRAIENGLTLVRHSDNGFSFISDPYGRNVAWEDHRGQEDAIMVAWAPVMTTRTLYPWVGDIVGQASVGGLLLVLFTVVIRYIRSVWQRQRRLVTDAT